jgi:DnaJ-class molecular chaperone
LHTSMKAIGQIMKHSEDILYRNLILCSSCSGNMNKGQNNINKCSKCKG